MKQYEEGNKFDLMKYRLETAKSDLKSAKILIEAEEYRAANNRAYYAIFHAISALHALDGKAYKRHKDALGRFHGQKKFDMQATMMIFISLQGRSRRNRLKRQKN